VLRVADDVTNGPSYKEMFVTCTISIGINNNYNLYLKHPSVRDSSVGMALGYGLDDRGSRVRFPAGAGNFSLHHRVQNGSEPHLASYPMGTRYSFPGGKTAGA
jgi:hypothetical protein